MIQVLRELLLRAGSNDSATRQEATLELALIVEKHSPRRDSSSFYGSMLPPELLRISLNDEEQKELVHEIGRIVLSDEVTPAMVWALTKSTSIEALHYLLSFICSDHPEQDEEALRQALIGIDAFLSVTDEHPMRDERVRLAESHNLRRALDRIRSQCGEEVREVAERVGRRLRAE